MIKVVVLDSCCQSLLLPLPLNANIADIIIMLLALSEISDILTHCWAEVKIFKFIINQQTLSVCLGDFAGLKPGSRARSQQF